MSNNTLPQQYAYRESAKDLPADDRPSPLHRGDVVTSFRGEDFTFEGVSRPAYGNSSGRVAVSRVCPDAYTNENGVRECPHMWHRGGIDRQEFFPSVFGLYLGDAEGNEA